MTKVDIKCEIVLECALKTLNQKVNNFEGNDWWFTLQATSAEYIVSSEGYEQ